MTDFPTLSCTSTSEITNLSVSWSLTKRTPFGRSLPILVIIIGEYRPPHPMNNCCRKERTIQVFFFILTLHYAYLLSLFGSSKVLPWLCDGRRANRTPLSRRQGCGKQRPGVPTYDIADNFANGLEGGESHLLQLRGASNTNCQSHHALWQLHCRNLPLGIKHRGSMQTAPRHLFRYIQEQNA